jgi:hypothetical protein
MARPLHNFHRAAWPAWPHCHHSTPPSFSAVAFFFFPLLARRYGETQVPDVWFDTKVVWEVKCADMSIR